VNAEKISLTVEAGAKAAFGVTEEPGRGGWLTPDGSLLNFERLGSASAGLDHSWLGDVSFWDELPVPAFVPAIAERTELSSYFVQAFWEGLARWTFRDGGLWVEAARMFTPAQTDRIRRVALRGDCLRAGLDLFPGPRDGRPLSRVVEAPNQVHLDRMLRNFRGSANLRQAEWHDWLTARGIAVEGVATGGRGLT
jgi:hypothetical protein